ncbi:hypothetical protein VTL71DRAFT_2000 [Oculimacula yallundae]|uniref:Glycosyltransferase n=1 Tax=Oculimacula yallundae TaxID=86028 RepID=A0ABR4CCB8_9HELO
MLRINHYISGHGYGHATRSSQIISALLSSSPTTYVTVITTAPQHLFPVSDRISFISGEVDSDIIQPQPYTIDAEASFTTLSTFLKKAETPEFQAKMDAILDESKCNLVLADASYGSAWRGAKRRGIKSIFVSNFSFDAIFEKLLAFLPEEKRQEGSEMVMELQKMYAEFDHVVRLPGYIAFPFIENHWTPEEKKRKVIDAPLVFRPARKGRDEVLTSLGVPSAMMGFKVLLVQFGGQLSQENSVREVPKLPEGWICLWSEKMDDPRFYKFPRDVYAPDLVGASDMVLGKIGYGTVSECLGMDKSLICVLRPMFAEEAGLLSYMTNNGSCQEISVADYESGDWTSTIESLHEAQKSRSKAILDEGSERVAKMIQEIAEGQ